MRFPHAVENDARPTAVSVEKMVAHLGEHFTVARAAKTLVGSQPITDVLFVVLHHSREHPGVFHGRIAAIDFAVFGCLQRVAQISHPAGEQRAACLKAVEINTASAGLGIQGLMQARMPVRLVKGLI